MKGEGKTVRATGRGFLFGCGPLVLLLIYEGGEKFFVIVCERIIIFHPGVKLCIISAK
jgi:hypothetical protein